MKWSWLVCWKRFSPLAWWCEQFTSQPSQRREGWGTRATARRILQSPRRTAGDEVELVGLLEAFQARWHGGASSLHPTLRKGAKDGAPGRSLGESSRVPGS